MLFKYSLTLLVVTLLVISQVILSYSNTAKDKWWFITVGVGVAIIVNIIWFYTAKSSADPDKLYKFGVIWDFMMGFLWLVIPAIFFKEGLTTPVTIGIVMSLIGSILIVVGRL